MVTKKIVRNEKGFTLIEIIAVLIILGILAAVAVPKFMDMQNEARKKAAVGALAALASQATMNYSSSLLKGETYSPTAGAEDYNVGDFAGGIAYDDTTGIITVTIGSGPTGWEKGLEDDSANSVKSFDVE